MWMPFRGALVLRTTANHSYSSRPPPLNTGQWLFRVLTARTVFLHSLSVDPSGAANLTFAAEIETPLDPSGLRVFLAGTECSPLDAPGSRVTIAEFACPAEGNEVSVVVDGPDGYLIPVGTYEGSLPPPEGSDGVRLLYFRPPAIVPPPIPRELCDPAEVYDETDCI